MRSRPCRSPARINFSPTDLAAHRARGRRGGAGARVLRLRRGADLHAGGERAGDARRRSARAPVGGWRAVAGLPAARLGPGAAAGRGADGSGRGHRRAARDAHPQPCRPAAAALGDRGTRLLHAAAADVGLALSAARRGRR